LLGACWIRIHHAVNHRPRLGAYLDEKLAMKNGERDLGNGQFPMQVRLLGTHFQRKFELILTFLLLKLN